MQPNRPWRVLAHDCSRVRTGLCPLFPSFWCHHKISPDRYYRNKIMHFFAQEALWCCAVYAAMHHGIAAFPTAPWPSKTLKSSAPSSRVPQVSGAFTPEVRLKDVQRVVTLMDNLLSREFPRYTPHGREKVCIFSALPLLYAIFLYFLTGSYGWPGAMFQVWGAEESEAGAGGILVHSQRR